MTRVLNREEIHGGVRVRASRPTPRAVGDPDPIAEQGISTTTPRRPAGAASARRPVTDRRGRSARGAATAFARSRMSWQGGPVHEFRVWAPYAASVEVVLPPSEARVPCAGEPGGWWSARVEHAGHGTDYWYSIDTGKPLPDPRSPWQPAGVHAPGRVFDPSRYVWASDDWPGADVRGGVLYELHVGTFTAEGTLDAAIARLDHLVELGVDVVQLMPLAAFEGVRGWGYDGVALYAVHQPYGGPEALQRFVDACHARDLAVSLDVVYNHLGPSGNYTESFGPYFTDRHHTPWGAAVNLDDTGGAEVRRWIVDNALRWFTDFRLDALRLDAVHALVDDSPVHLLSQLSQEAAALSRRLGRPLSLIAESDLNDPRTVEPAVPAGAGGRGMTAQWSDDLHHALHALVTGETDGYYVDFGTVDVLARTLTRVFRHDGDWSQFRGRVWGRPVDPSRHRGHQFLGYAQTHDQIGNRAAGERLGALAPAGRVAATAAVVLTSPFTPMLFMGEEWAAGTPWQFFTDFDAHLGDKVLQGRREEFSRHGWDPDTIPDPQDPATRDRSVLRWSERSQPQHARMLAWYRDLIALRRTRPDLRDDDLSRVRVTTGPGSDTVGSGWLVVHRGGCDVLVNLAGGPAVLPCPDDADVLLGWDRPQRVDGGLRLPGDGAVIVDVRRSAAPPPV
jgi:maltooligosyltrehalose trehalohydrolase